MKVSILGCGWFGSALAKSLIGQGVDVKGSTTSPQKLAVLQAGGIPACLVNITTIGESVIDHSFFDCDLLVISITTRGKDDTPYLSKIDLIASLAQRHNIKRVLFISSISVYGDHNETVNELTPPRPEKKAGELLLAAELKLKSCPAFITAVIRFGGLVGPGRDPGNFLAGKTGVPNGLAPVNLIHLDDCTGITERIIFPGPADYTINAVAPDHPTKTEFYTAAARVAGTVPPVFIPEREQWKIVKSIYMDELKYHYKTTNWLEWLKKPGIDDNKRA